MTGLVIISTIIITIISSSHWIYTMLIIVSVVIVPLIGFEYNKIIMSHKTQNETARRLIISMRNDIQVASDRLHAAVEEVNRYSNDLLTNAEYSQQNEFRLRTDSKQVNMHIEDAYAKMQEVMSVTDEILTKTDQLTSKMSATKDIVSEVVKSLHNTDSVMNKVEQNSVRMKDEINELIDHINKIEEINEIITAISGETSLLALNASIEAARAGGFGRGFAVVANRIKQLSNQSKTAVEQSSVILNNITSGITQVVKSVDLERMSVKESLAEVKQVKKRIDIINNEVSEVDTIVENVVSSTELQSSLIESTQGELSKSVQIINDMISNIDLTLGQVSNRREQINALNRVS